MLLFCYDSSSQLSSLWIFMPSQEQMDHSLSWLVLKETWMVTHKLVQKRWYTQNLHMRFLQFWPNIFEVCSIFVPNRSVKNIIRFPSFANVIFLNLTLCFQNRQVFSIGVVRWFAFFLSPLFAFLYIWGGTRFICGNWSCRRNNWRLIANIFWKM